MGKNALIDTFIISQFLTNWIGVTWTETFCSTQISLSQEGLNVFFFFKSRIWKIQFNRAENSHCSIRRGSIHQWWWIVHTRAVEGWIDYDFKFSNGQHFVNYSTHCYFWRANHHITVSCAINEWFCTLNRIKALKINSTLWILSI